MIRMHSEATGDRNLPGMGQPHEGPDGHAHKPRSLRYRIAGPNTLSTLCHPSSRNRQSESSPRVACAWKMPPHSLLTWFHCRTRYAFVRGSTSGSGGCSQRPCICQRTALVRMRTEQGACACRTGSGCGGSGAPGHESATSAALRQMRVCACKAARHRQHPMGPVDRGLL